MVHGQWVGLGQDKQAKILYTQNGAQEKQYCRPGRCKKKLQTQKPPQNKGKKIHTQIVSLPTSKFKPVSIYTPDPNQFMPGHASKTMTKRKKHGFLAITEHPGLDQWC